MHAQLSLHDLIDFVTFFRCTFHHSSSTHHDNHDQTHRNHSFIGLEGAVIIAASSMRVIVIFFGERCGGLLFNGCILALQFYLGSFVVAVVFFIMLSFLFTLIFLLEDALFSFAFRW